jgi:hypothetical protein
MTGFRSKAVPHPTTVLAGFIPAIHGGASLALEPPILRGSHRLAPQGEGSPLLHPEEPHLRGLEGVVGGDSEEEHVTVPSNFNTNEPPL